MTNETPVSQAPTIIRTFVALDLPMGVKAMVGTIQDEMKEYIGEPANSIKWVRPTGVHLTLQFLGNILSDHVEAVEGALRVAASGIAPFTLNLAHLGAFPDVKRPRVIWIGVESDAEGMKELHSLHAAVAYRLSEMGFKTESQFKPHLTLGRMREEVSRSDLASIGTSISDLQARASFEASFLVTSVHLLKSVLHPGGAVYTELANVEFGRKPK